MTEDANNPPVSKCAKKPAKQLVPFHFPKGVSGNPNGRPKLSWSKVLGDVASANEVTLKLRVGTRTRYITIKSDYELRYAVAAVLFREALAGNVPAAKEIFERMDGKTVQPIAMDFQNPPPLVFDRYEKNPPKVIDITEGGNGKNGGNGHHHLEPHDGNNGNGNNGNGGS